MCVFGVARDAQQWLLTIDSEADAVPTELPCELLGFDEDWAFQASSVAQLLAPGDVLSQREWKLQTECQQPKDQRRAKEGDQIGVAVNPVAEEEPQATALIKTRCLTEDARVPCAFGDGGRFHGERMTTRLR